MDFVSRYSTAAMASGGGPPGQACVCGRSFSLPSAYSKHKRTCGTTKKRLSSALDKAKEMWREKKQRQRDHGQAIVSQPSSSGLLPLPLPETQGTIMVNHNFTSKSNLIGCL